MKIFHYGKLLSREGDKIIHHKTGQEGLNCSKENFVQMLEKSFLSVKVAQHRNQLPRESGISVTGGFEEQAS